MKKILLNIFLFFSVLFNTIFSEELVIEDITTKNHLSEIRKGLDALHNGEYEASIAIFDKMRQEEPDHPMGHMFYAAALEWVMFDFRNFFNEDKFMESINMAIDLSDKWIEREPQNPWAYFYAGGSYGFRGIYYTDYGNLVQTFLDGFHGYKNLEKTLELKPELTDAYYGVAMWNYWRNYYVRFVGAEEKRALGIEQIKMVAEKGMLTKVEASSSLIRILFTEDEPQAAQAHISALLEKFPNYLYARWYRAKGYALNENWVKSKESFLWLHDYFSKHTRLRSQTALIEVDYNIANAAYNMGQLEEARTYLKNVLNNEPSEDVGKKDEDEKNEKMKLLKEYKNKAIKLLNKVENELKSN